MAASLTLPLITSAACASAAQAESAAPAESADASDSLFDPDRHLRAADVRVGMTGYGLSVFAGTKLERFDVEVVAVLPSTEQIDTTSILVRCSGQDLEISGPVRGMSGSPIYLTCDDGKDRLIGAFAFGWPGMKAPLVGIQPIEKMLELQAHPAAQSGELAMAGRLDAQAWQTRYSRWLTGDLVGDLGTRTIDQSVDRDRPHTTMQPLALPIPGSGDAVRRLIRDQELDGLLVVPLDAPTIGRAGDDTADKIVPGGPLVIPMVSGDYNLGVIGTCTERIGDRVYGFGHPFTGEGESGLPFSGGVVHAVVPLNEISFKLGSAGPIQGTLATDASSGIAGQVGVAPDLIDLDINITRPAANGQTLKATQVKVARHRSFTPTMLATVLGEAMALPGSGAGDDRGSMTWSSTIHLAGRDEPVRLNGVEPAASPDAPLFAIPTVVELLTENPFAGVKIESVTFDATFESPAESRTLRLAEASLLQRTARPGQTVKLLIELQSFRNEARQLIVPLRLPDDLRSGTYIVAVGPAGNAASVDVGFGAVEPASLEELLDQLARMADFDEGKLYVQLLDESGRSLVRRGQTLADLPPTRRLLLEPQLTTAGDPVVRATATADLTGKLLGNPIELTLTVTQP